MSKTEAKEAVAAADGRRLRSQREAVDALTSFEMWQRLRYHQGLGKVAAINFITGLLSSLVED